MDSSDLTHRRVHHPEAIAEAAASRRRPASLFDPHHGRVMIVAADHAARGTLRAGERPLAMANRADLLERLVHALSRPGVNGVLGTPDVIEDLLLLGVLDEKVVIGSMNRGGLAGTSFELDDRFTAYDAPSIAAAGLEGGKMLLRIDPDDPASVRTIEACARAVGELAERHLLALVEPFLARRIDGALRVDLTPEAAMRALTIAAGLGPTSAYTWLKVPVVDEIETVMRASTLPALLLGGEVRSDPEATFARWALALAQPTVMGLVVGRSLLYPVDDDVTGAVDHAVRLLVEAGGLAADSEPVRRGRG